MLITTIPLLLSFHQCNSAGFRAGQVDRKESIAAHKNGKQLDSSAPTLRERYGYCRWRETLKYSARRGIRAAV